MSIKTKPYDLIRNGFVIMAFLSVTSILQAQSISSNYDPFTREVIVTSADETIHAHILDKEKKITAKPELKYTWYTRNMLMETQGGFSGKVLHGPYQSHFRNHQIKAEGYYHFGLKKDEWRYWDDQGKLTAIYTWRKGMKHGFFSEYKNGEVTRQGNFRKGELHGQVREYEDGEVSGTNRYRNGEVVEEKLKVESKKLKEGKAKGKSEKEKVEAEPKQPREKKEKVQKEKRTKSKRIKSDKDE